MFERPGPFRRPTAFGDQSASQRPRSAAQESVEGLTRAQSRALSRCAPLTPEEFKARRRVAEQGLVSLREVLDADADARLRTEVDRGQA